MKTNKQNPKRNPSRPTNGTRSPRTVKNKMTTVNLSCALEIGAELSPIYLFALIFRKNGAVSLHTINSDPKHLVLPKIMMQLSLYTLKRILST